MEKKYRVVIAEDHTILREGLRSLVASSPDFQVVSEAEDGYAAILCAEKHKPDILLLDLSMPRLNGLEAIKGIKKVSNKTKVVVLTVHKADEYILASLRAGADGYMLKNENFADLLTAFKSVLSGKQYLSPEISGTVLDGNKTLKKTTAWDSISQREREILKLIAEDYKSKDIALLLFISIKTVEKHRANLMKKLNLHSVSALTALAIEKGLVTR
jgi:two-component system, NarL family, response regulator NreC